ncbi:yrdC domain-containing protein, mitochondrial [Contarinia nasturtii]|uniref:yrdC domain-containing protein, mitochondrial n=1 Tax=Contarinia nasturtii TaxID=265458 RepID=UPI0012D4B787|nr:yrdC domain-containing protein, mitochondrial [Contarinia nasturtii]
MKRFFNNLNRYLLPIENMNSKLSDINMNSVKFSNCIKPMGTMKIMNCFDSHAVEVAADLLHHGEVIALPTDTVYGLACSANNPHAIQKLYEIKGRDEEKPVAVCVSSISQLKHYSEASHLSDDLLSRLLPGAVTIILHKSKYLNNPFLNNGIKKIGLRIPDSEFIQKISTKFIEPIALTSANKSGACSTLDVYEFNDLWPELSVVFDGGHLGDKDNDMKQRCASTVVDLSIPGCYQIIRNGIAMEHTVRTMNEFGIKNV